MRHETTKPRIAVTMGDPAGVGPEVVLKALAHSDAAELCEAVVFGDLDWLRRTARELALPLTVDSENNDADIRVRQATGADLREIASGEVAAEAGRAAAECVTAAAKATLTGEFDALVTAPLNKEAMALGGFPYPGHTELLAEITQTPHYGMLLVSENLRVVHVSTHVSLREAIERVKTARILECIRLGRHACRELGIAEPHIAVAGLNPHAGENGLFGTEDRDEILPAVIQAQREGIRASGPYPPDTLFGRAAAGEFALVVAMYHDQGHIPVKMHGLDSGVNITIGLPIVRVSVDHGTAFDIAGQGIAREYSMLLALRVAVQMAQAKGTAHAD